MIQASRREIDDYLVISFGEAVMQRSEAERDGLYSFCLAIAYLGANKRNLEFNQH